MLNISIHSPYTGRDFTVTPVSRCDMNFNPLSLYRERHIEAERVRNGMSFQSTLPIQGETICMGLQRNRKRHFNPLSLYSERPPQPSRSAFPRYFNPLSLYRERHFQNGRRVKVSHFNPLSLYRERQIIFTKAMRQWNFNPLSLYRERPN